LMVNACFAAFALVCEYTLFTPIQVT